MCEYAALNAALHNIEKKKKNYLIFCVFHNHSRHPPNYCHSQPYPCIRNDVRRNLYSCPQHIKKSAYTTHVRPLLEYSSSVWDPHTKTLKNKIEMVQRRAARFCHNDYETIEKGCVSEMIRKLNLGLERLNIRRTNKRLTIFHKAIHKAINGHLALPIGHLQPVLRRTRHLNSKEHNNIHTSKEIYKVVVKWWSISIL